MNDRSGDPILYRSKHRGLLSTQLHTSIADVHVSVRTWSEQQYDDFLSHDYEMVGSKIIFPIKTLPAQTIPEIILSKKINSYKASLKISNLLDTSYELIQDYPMPGRTWYVTLTKSL
jgi:outer membrane cobalamin receptor